VTKAYCDTKFSPLGGSMQGGIAMSGNKISHLGEPEQSNDALRLSSGNDVMGKIGCEMIYL